MPLGNIKDDSIQSIMNSDRTRQLRLNMLNGVESPECVYCYTNEKNGADSYRINSNREWARYSELADQTALDGSFISFTPYYIDIRLNNICNLKCRSCSGYYSSSIAQEEREQFGANYVNLTQTEKINSLNEIKKYLGSAEKIYFAGGEPLIMAEHYLILDELLATNNVNSEMYYNTNFTNLKFKDKNILDYWKKFSNVQVGASIDGEGAAAEYWRHGTVWSDVENNMAQLRATCPKVRVRITSTLNLANAESLIRMQRSWIDKFSIPANNFHVAPLIKPNHLNIQTLPAHHKTRLTAIITDHITWLKTIANSDTLVDLWTNMIQFMLRDDPTDPDPANQFKHINNRVDKWRNESFSATFPEYADLVK